MSFRQVAVLLRIQMERLKHSEESGVVLILGTTDWQRHMIYKELQRIDPSLAPSTSEEAGPSSVPEVKPYCSRLASVHEVKPCCI